MRKRNKARDRAYSAEHRAKYPGANFRRVKARKAVMLAMIRRYKAVPCMDCGLSYPPYVMHLDHRDPAQKLANPSQLPRLGWSEARVLQELAKCDPVCANCHAERTFGPKPD